MKFFRKKHSETGSALLGGLVLITITFTLVFGFAALKYFAVTNTIARYSVEASVLAAAVYYTDKYPHADSLANATIVATDFWVLNSGLTKLGRLHSSSTSGVVTPPVEGLYDFSSPSCSGACYTEPVPAGSTPNSLRLSVSVNSGSASASPLGLADAFHISKSFRSVAAFNSSNGVVLVNTN